MTDVKVDPFYRFNGQITVTDADGLETEYQGTGFIIPAGAVTVTPVFNEIEVTANASPAAGGTVAVSKDYATGCTTFTATANEGYEFLNWTNDYDYVYSTDAVYSFYPDYSVNLTANFMAVTEPLAAENVTLSAASFPYNGGVQKPNVTVTNAAGETLMENTDYTLTWSDANSSAPGSYTVTVTGMGGYTGEITATYQILTPPTITKQPIDTVGELNKGVNFKVEATGEGDLSYRWEKSTDGGNTWTVLSGRTTDTLASTASLANDGVQYRCKVTDSNGSTYSNAATLRTAQLNITKHPGGQIGELNKGVNYKIETTGDDVSLQWQKSTDGGNTWVDLAGKTGNLLTATASNANHGAYYRCKVTDKNGLSVYSKAAILKTAQLNITKHPGGQIGQLNKGVNYKIEVTGDNVSIQWQKSTDGGKTWTDIAGKTGNLLTATASNANHGAYYRCKVTDKNGLSVYSKAAILKVAQVNITKQPGGRIGQLNKNVIFEIAVSGDNVSLQWQKSTDGGKTWKDLSGCTAPKLTSLASLANNGAYYRCKVTDKNGLSVYSSAAILKTAQLNITAQPKSVSAAAGTKATFSVTATGDNVTYKWQKSTDGGATWTDLAGYTNPSFAITLKAAHNGVRYRCVLTDKAGVAFNSNTAMVTVK